MSRSIERQGDQWSLPDRQASSTYEPSQAELRDLLSGPKIQAGMLNTREASVKTADQIPTSGMPEDLQEHQLFQKWLSEHPNFHEWLDERVLYPIWLEEHQNVGPGRVTEAAILRKASPRENPAGDLNLSPRRLDQQATQVQTKALKPPKLKPIPDDLGQDKSFKVPNQMTAQHDPQLPPRGYLASFMRNADTTSKDVENMLFPNGKPKNWGSATDSSATNVTLPPSGAAAPPPKGGPQSGPGGSPIMTTPGSPLISQPPAAPAPAPNAPAAQSNQNATPATNVSDTKPATGGGGNTGGSGGGNPGGGGGGWQARDIAPGSIDTSKTYTVQSGDTLSEIAQGAGIKDYNDIAKANNIADPNKIDVGQQIKFSPSPGGPSTPVDQTPAAAATSDASTPLAAEAPTPAEGSPSAVPMVGNGAAAIPGKEARRHSDPPLPPPGTLKKFLAGSRRFADTEEDRKRGTQYNPANTNPGLNNPPAPQSGGGQQNSPWFTPPAPGQGPTPSQEAHEPVKAPPATPTPSQPTVPNTPASSDSVQDAPGKTNDLAGASNPNSPAPSQPAGNPAEPPAPASPSGTDQPKTPGQYGPQLGGGTSLSDVMGVIGGVGQGINTALSIGGTLMGALGGGGLGSLISGFGGLGMLGSTLGITAAAQQQIKSSERAVKEQYV